MADVDQNLSTTSGKGKRPTKSAEQPSAAPVENKKSTIKNFAFPKLLVLAFGVLLAVLAAGWYGQVSRVELADLVTHTNEVINKTQLVLSTMQDAETGQRGFIITGEDQYLEPFNAARAIEAQLTADLYKLVDDNPAQQTRIKQFEDLMAEKFVEMESTIQLRRDLGFEAAQDVVITDAGKVIMDKIRVLIDEVIAIEKELELQRITAVEKLEVQLLLAGIIGFYLFIGIASIVFIRFRRVLNAQVTAAQSLQNRTEFQEVVFETMADGLVVINPKGRIVSVNQAIVDLFGYASDELVGQNVNMLMKGENKRDHDDYLLSFLKAGNSKIIGVGPRAVQGCTKEGKKLDLELSVDVSIDNGKTIFVGCLRDLTDKNRILEKSNADLEKFAYMASHDLKSPLKAIDSLAHWIEKDLKGHIKGKVRENMELLHNRVAILDSLLDDLLEYSRARFTDDALEQVDVSSVVKKITTILDMPKSFKIKISGKLPKLLAPRGAIDQVLNNLITNALKHHDKTSGTITVSAANKGRFWEIAVADDGPGIPAKYHDQIFKMFKKLENQDRVKGSGMGLAIIKEVVEAQSGEVRIMSSSKKRGATFYFTWPKIENSDSL